MLGLCCRVDTGFNIKQSNINISRDGRFTKRFDLALAKDKNGEEEDGEDFMLKPGEEVVEEMAVMMTMMTAASNGGTRLICLLANY